MTTEELIEQAEAMLRIATRGPWEAGNGAVWNSALYGPGCSPECICEFCEDGDARFIAWCREGVPSLIAALRESEDSVRVLNEELTKTKKEASLFARTFDQLRARIAELEAERDRLRALVVNGGDTHNGTLSILLDPTGARLGETLGEFMDRALNHGGRRMTTEEKVVECRYCENGELWTECCSGASGCECQGRQISMGPCRVCGGSGYYTEGETDTRANINMIRSAAEATGGYLGNPTGRTR